MHTDLWLCRVFLCVSTFCSSGTFGSGLRQGSCRCSSFSSALGGVCSAPGSAFCPWAKCMQVCPVVTGTAEGWGDLVGRKFGVGNLAFQFGRQISHAKSRAFLLCPPIPLCFACSTSHSLFLPSTKFPTARFITAKLTRHPPPPPVHYNLPAFDIAVARSRTDGSATDGCCAFHCSRKDHKLRLGANTGVILRCQGTPLSHASVQERQELCHIGHIVCVESFHTEVAPAPAKTMPAVISACMALFGYYS